jgi:hypothetical protein
MYQQFSLLYRVIFPGIVGLALVTVVRARKRDKRRSDPLVVYRAVVDFRHSQPERLGHVCQSLAI